MLAKKVPNIISIPNGGGDFHGGEAQYGIPIRKKETPSKKKNKSKSHTIQSIHETGIFAYN